MPQWSISPHGLRRYKVIRLTWLVNILSWTSLNLPFCQTDMSAVEQFRGIGSRLSQSTEHYWSVCCQISPRSVSVEPQLAVQHWHLFPVHRSLSMLLGKGTACLRGTACWTYRNRPSFTTAVSSWLVNKFLFLVLSAVTSCMSKPRHVNHHQNKEVASHEGGKSPWTEKVFVSLKVLSLIIKKWAVEMSSSQ